MICVADISVLNAVKFEQKPTVGVNIGHLPIWSLNARQNRYFGYFFLYAADVYTYLLFLPKAKC